MDDLSGLDWSSRPVGNQPKPPLMNSFSSFRASPMTSGQGTPLPAQGPNASQPKQAPSKASQDSFSNLMNFGSSRTTQNLTLAERQAQLEAEKRQRQEESRRQAEAQFGNGTQWEALGSRGFTPSPALQQPATASRAKDDDDDLFAAFNRDTKVDNASHYPPPAPQKKGLDLSDPTAWTTTATTTSTTTTTTTSTTNTATATDLNEYFGVDNEGNDDDPFGLNEFELEASARGPQTAASVPAAASDDFDFLGDLARPVDEVRREQEAKQQAARQAIRESSRPEPGKPIEDDSSSSDDDEPIERIPDRVPKANKDSFDRAVAQLVDYGFSPEEARRGLSESGAGSNAQAAANWLLDEAHRKAKENAQGRSSHRSSPAPAYQHGRGEVDLAKSAAAVGNSLFKSANSLWKTGQKKMQQAVAEFQQDGGDPSQPKWMREAHQGQTQARARPSRADVTDEALMLESGGRPQQVQQPVHRESRPSSQPRPSRERGESPAASSAPASRNSPAPRWQQQPPAPSMSDARSRLQRLKVDDDDGFSVSVGANRRKKASPAPEPRKPEAEPDLLFNTTVPERPTSSAPSHRSQRQTPVPTDRPQATVAPRKTTPKPARQIPSLSPDALRDSTRHRHQGTAHFKRGDYASAHASYTAATSSIPSTHPLMIVLLTNRALTALKIGEPKEAVTNADEALRVIGPGNGQGETVAVRSENGQDENRDMKELYGKALSRKAEALEQMEKWADAGSVWQLCMQAGVGGPLVIKGRQRCQEALTPKPKAAPKPMAKPRPAPSASLAPAKDSEAVIRLREANEAAVKEDDEKFALADKVDAKVSAWRDGKRDNLRALISSLDNVLWENSGWKKVGLHELLQPNKVKISYMKAIAKTHPDKLPQDANTEVRLIAGLVFSTLNESWDKFKSENGL